MKKGSISPNRLLTREINYRKPSYSMLTAIEYSDSVNGRTIIKCKCSCGTFKNCVLYRVISGRQHSCGCFTKNEQHGLRNHPLYTVWYNMKLRCYEPSTKYFNRYGGRGIKVSDAWVKKFSVFYNWAIVSWKKGLTLDRINNDGDYAENNCRFIDRKLQSRNKDNNLSITYNGETLLIIEWAEKLGINVHTLYGRYYKGLAPEKILYKGNYSGSATGAGKPIKLYNINGENLCLSEAVRKYAVVQRAAVRSRLRKGMSLEEALFLPPTNKLFGST